MNKRKVIDKSKLVIVVFFVLSFWAPPGIRAESPPSPPAKFSFDISRRDNEIKKEIRIREYRSYYINLLFSHPDSLVSQR